MYSTATVLKIVKEAEAATIAKKKGKKRQLPPKELIVYILMLEIVIPTLIEPYRRSL